jgi:hypothetical protein
MSIPTDTEIAALAAALADAKRKYDSVNASTKEVNSVMVEKKDALLKAVLAVHHVPEGHFELIPKKNLVYQIPGLERPLVLQGKDGEAVFNMYSDEQKAYLKQIDDQIEILQLKKNQVVPVKVEIHATRSYSVTWGK